MDQKTILSQLQEILRHVSNLQNTASPDIVLPVSETTYYLDIGLVDSLHLTTFILMIESTFSITLTQSQIQSLDFRTLKGLSKIVLQNLGK